MSIDLELMNADTGARIEVWGEEAVVYGTGEADTTVDYSSMTMEERQEARRIVRDCWVKLQDLMERTRNRALSPDELPAWADGPVEYQETVAGRPFGEVDES